MWPLSGHYLRYHVGMVLGPPRISLVGLEIDDTRGNFLKEVRIVISEIIESK